MVHRAGWPGHREADEVTKTGRTQTQEANSGDAGSPSSSAMASHRRFSLGTAVGTAERPSSGSARSTDRVGVTETDIAMVWNFVGWTVQEKNDEIRNCSVDVYRTCVP